MSSILASTLPTIPTVAVDDRTKTPLPLVLPSLSEDSVVALLEMPSHSAKFAYDILQVFAKKEIYLVDSTLYSNSNAVVNTSASIFIPSNSML
jgi:hypothetical protein